MNAGASGPMTLTSWLAVAIFVVAYLLIATEKIHRVRAALGGAALMLLIGAIDGEHAFFSAESGIDWNVIFLLLGMMLIVAVLRRTGGFEFLAIWSVKRARGRPFRVMVLLALVTAVASAALDNVTTVLLIAPVTIAICRRLDLPVAPYLIAEALASNVGGTATLVGDPPNIIIASRAGLSYNDFLSNLAPFVAVLLIGIFVAFRLLFRRSFRYDPERVAEVMELRERDAITNPRLLALSLAVLTVVTAAFALHAVLHLQPSVIAVLGGMTLLAASGLDPEEVAKDVEWPTLLFFIGLFVMVGALVNTGVVRQLADLASAATEGHLYVASSVLLWGSAAMSALVDNIPYVATMAPVVEDIVSGRAEGGHAQVLWWVLALGADLGGNATAIGASANVVVLGIADRAGRKISFWEFTRYGLVVTLVSIALAMPYLWLRYFAFG